MIRRYSDRLASHGDGGRLSPDSQKNPLRRVVPSLAVAIFILTGCGGSVWTNGFQRAISIIPGIDMADVLPAEDEALRPGYRPGGPVDIVVADQDPIGEPADDPGVTPVMAEPAPAMTEAPAAPVMAAMEATMGEALLMGEAALDNSLLGRMQRVELGLLRLEADFQAMRPGIERLVAVDADLDELVDQLFLLVSQGAEVVAPAAAAPPAQQQAAGAPTPLIPVGDGGPPPFTPLPTPGLAAVPPAPLAPAVGQFALHLASYRLRDNAIIGWTEIMAAVPGQLAGLNPGTSNFNKGADGQFVRLKAGPLVSEADAEARCLAIQAAGRYCSVMAYAGTTPF
jgi:hypothetical protein